MKILMILCCLLVCFSVTVFAQHEEKFDSAAVAQIKDEGMNRSQVMDILSYLTDVYGPRLTGSPGYMRAADWARGKMTSMGLENAHLEKWGPFGKGWTLKHYSANVLNGQNFPLISYPKAWIQGTNGPVTGDIIYVDAKTDSALQQYKGKLKGKFVMLGDEREIKAHWDPEATRVPDSSLIKMANADFPMPGGRFGGMRNLPADQKARALVEFHKLDWCQKEGAAGILTNARGDGGTIFVQQASVPAHPDTPFTSRTSAYENKAPKLIPQIAVAAEHYNRLVRMIARGQHPKLQLDVDVEFNKADSIANIIGELPGSDLKDEIVMIGAHFDSWHGGTGATDNGTGSAVCLEAMRILKAAGLKPRRTIRIGLWGGEEEGLLGSEAYVKQHFGERKGQRSDPTSTLNLKPEADKFDVYFNNDNGSGKVRGVYLQGNDLVRNIFRKWLAPFKDMGASTLSLQNTGGTDHLSFDAVELPGFQFIQDELEYSSRTHHSTMDLYDRAQPDDLKQAAVIMAAFAYNASMRAEKFPHKPLPAPAPAAGSN
ncbi:MAG TPA: M20/M25/M40 family metallo-hydrolase [Bacteroidota bacterium]|nr:M20/M25/M40 family metallo-hydrolase [Bacteroidota bacterium]